jgi:BMFP domain-containing protein YqiC
MSSKWAMQRGTRHVVASSRKSRFRLTKSGGWRMIAQEIGELKMTQYDNRLLDDVAKLFTSAAGAAQGLRQEIEAIVKGQAERLIADLDLVSRDEFDAVQAMAARAREENDALKARIEALEAAASSQS